MPAGVFFMPKHDNVFTVSSHRLSCFFGNNVVKFSEPLHVCAARTGEPDPAACAKRRCVGAHKLLASIKHHPVGLAALVGYYIDCHIPSMLFVGSVCDLYRAKREPESSSDFPQTSYPFNGMTSVVTKTWHSHAHHEVLDVLVKLLRKGGPSPSSVRYVSGLLKRCTSNPSSAAVMRNMYLSSTLGGYRHSDTIADVAVRIRAYQMSTLDLYQKVCTPQSTRDLHAMVSMFVCANTLENEALRTSITTADLQHATETVALARPGVGRRARKNVSSSYSVFSVMLKALGVSHTSHASFVARYGAAAAANIETHAIGTKQFSVHAGTFRAIGLDAAECAAVTRCFSNVGFTSLKMLRHYLKGVKLRSKHSLALFMWYTHQELHLSLRPLHETASALQLTHMLVLHNTRSSAATVCHRCAALKIQVGEVAVAKTKMGVAVNPINSTAQCNACGSSRVTLVELIGHAVHMLHKCKRTTVVLCCRCLLPTSSFSTVGVFPVCSHCKPVALKRLFTPPVCLCGRPAVGRLGWYPATAGGEVTPAAVCAVHAHLLPDVAVNTGDMIQEMGGCLNATP